MSRKCNVCGEEIPHARIEILPTTTTCIKHSTIDKKMGRHITVGTGDNIHNECDIIDNETLYRR